jgi:hypothetical protein
MCHLLRRVTPQRCQRCSPAVGAFNLVLLAAVLSASADDAAPVDEPGSAGGQIAVAVVDQRGAPVAGAWVAALDGSLKKMAEATTGVDGKVLLRIPPGARAQNVFASKPGVGLDYFAYRREREPKSTPYKLAANHREPLTLVLNGVRPVTVKVVDEHDQPLAGLPVQPWYFSKPKKGEDLNLGSLDEFKVVTDAAGSARFLTVPADNTGKVTFLVMTKDYHSPERPVFDLEGESSQVVARLLPLVPVSGRATFANGLPAADIEVSAVGDGMTFNGFRGTTRTDEKGLFRMTVFPDQFYLFSAANKHSASPVDPRVIRLGEPVDDIELVLRNATRVYGQLTVGDDRRPLANEYLALYRHAGEDFYYKLPPDQQLPNPSKRNKAVFPVLVNSTHTDSDGRFEFIAGPGHCYVIGPHGTERPRFEITSQAELEVNLHTARPRTERLVGRVLAPETNISVAEAKIIGVPRLADGLYLNAIADANGKFSVDRTPCETMFMATSADGKLAGAVMVKPDDTACLISLAPNQSLSGRLLDAKTGDPLPNREVSCSIKIDLSDGTMMFPHGVRAKSDAQGEFKVEGLVVGGVYHVAVISDRDPDSQLFHRQNLGTVKPTTDKALSLGDVRVQLR